MTGLFLCLLQYEGRRSALPLGLSKTPQVQVLGLVTCPYMMWHQALLRLLSLQML